MIQGNRLNRTRIATVICVALTTSLQWAEAPGNVLLTPDETGLPKSSVANVSQVATVDKAVLTEQAGKLPKPKLELVLAGIDLMLGR